MPTQPRTHSGATQIVTEILKDAAKPRQAVSVKKALRKAPCSCRPGNA